METLSKKLLEVQTENKVLKRKLQDLEHKEQPESEISIQNPFAAVLSRLKVEPLSSSQQSATSDIPEKKIKAENDSSPTNADEKNFTLEKSNKVAESRLQIKEISKRNEGGEKVRCILFMVSD